MMIVIGTLTAKLPTIAWYRSSSGSAKITIAISTSFIGKSCSVCATTRAAPARVAARPLRIPDKIDLRTETSVQRPPISIAPTPR